LFSSIRSAASCCHPLHAACELVELIFKSKPIWEEMIDKARA